jgi:hypothetical protein
VTAINLAIANNGAVAYLLVDTAVSKGDRRLLGHNAKVRTYPHARAMFAGRGPVHLLSMLEQSFQFCATFDEMVATFQQRCADSTGFKIVRAISGLIGLISKSDNAGGKAPLNHVEILLCGWSDTSKRMMAVTASSNRRGDRMPFVPSLTEVFLAPGLPEGVGQKLLDATESSQKDQTEYPSFLLNAMQKQRERAEQMKTEVIGGSAVLTVLTKSHISQRVLHSWNDVLGECVGSG